MGGGAAWMMLQDFNGPADPALVIFTLAIAVVVIGMTFAVIYHALRG